MFRRLIVLTTLGSVAFLTVVGATPVTLTVDDATPEATLEIDGHPTRHVAIPIAGPQRIRVVDESSEGQVVELALPVVDSKRLRVEELESVSGWRVITNGERLEAQHAGATLTLAGTLGNLELAFVGRPHGGRVRITSEGFEQLVELTQPNEDWSVVQVPAPRTRLIRAFSLFERPSQVVVAKLRPGAVVTLRLGHQTELARLVASGEPVTITVPTRATLARLMLERQSPLVVVVLTALAILMTAWAVGWIILRATGRPTRSAHSFLLAVVVGGSLWALVANSLSYFFPTDTLTWPARIVAVLAIVVAAWLSRSAPGGVESDELPFEVVCASLLGAFANFWPVILGGMGAIGLLQTDSFYYTTTSELIGERGLLESIASGSTIGHGMRSIDVAAAAMAISMLGVNANIVWLALPGIALVLSPMFVYYVTRDWVGDRRVARLTAVLAAASPSLGGLFVEAYLSQFLLTPVLLGGVMVTSESLKRLNEGERNRRLLVPCAITIAIALLLYPYFAVTAFLAVPALWLAWNGQGVGARSRAIGWLGVQIALLCNIGLFFFANAGVSKKYTPRLNEIAEWVVFPFHDQPQFSAFILGLMPFHANPAHLEELVSEYSHAPVLEWWLAMVRAFNTPATWIIGGMILLTALGGGVYRLRDHLRSDTGRLVLAAIPVFLILAAVARLTSGLYGYCKLMWTASTILPLAIIPVVGLIALDSRLTHRVFRVTAWAVLCTLLVAGVISKVFGSVYWLGHDRGSAEKNLSIAADIQRVDTWQRGHAPRRFAFISRDGAGLDQPRQVLSAHAYGVLETSGWECTNAQFDRDGLGFRSFDATADLPSTVIEIGISHGAMDGWRPVEQGDLFTILERVAN